MITPLIRPLLVGSAILGLTGVVFFFPIPVPEDPAQQPPRPTFGKEAQEWLFRQRTYPAGSIPDGALDKAWRASMLGIASDQLDTPGDQWTNIGPAPIVGGQVEGYPPDRRVTGRLVDIAVDENQPGHWFVATAGGGIWETTNSGESWSPKTDAVVSLATTTVALARSNPQVLFAGTHDISGTGVALLKSIDGGTNWQAATKEFPNQTYFHFTTVEIAPNDPDTVLVVTSEVYNPGGVFKSTDGGKTFGPPKLRGNGSSLQINSTNFLQQYAGIRNNYGGFYNGFNGVYRSTDGGDSWEQVNGPWDASIMVAGGDVKIAMARTQAALESNAPGGGTVYVILPTVRPPDEPPIPGGIWKSENAWAKTPDWIQLETAPNEFDSPVTVMVDPLDEDVLYIGGYGGLGFYRYDPTQNPRWQSIVNTTHVDQQALAAEGSKLLLGNDGGFWISTNRGNSWTHKNTNLSTIQFYAGSFNPFNALEALGGSQDNGSEWWTGNPPWKFIYEGDGGYNAFSTTNHDTWLVSAQTLGWVRRVTQAGNVNVDGMGAGSTRINPAGAGFIAPIRRAPHSNIVLAGSDNLWKSANFFALNTTPQWYPNGPEMGAEISAIAFAPSDPCSLIYAFGTGNGALRITFSGGSEGMGAQTPDEVGPWKNLDPLGQVPGRFVKAIAFHPTNPAIIYVALSGFDGATPGHIFKTLNGLDTYPTWENVTPNPFGLERVDLPINALAIDPANPNIIYAGAELGVWKSTDNGALNSWTFMGPGSGMPNVPVFDLAFNPVDGHLFAFTYGRGAFKLNATTVIPTQPRLANISTRINVGTQDNVLIGGFIIAGPACSTKQIVLRGLGPSTGLGGHLEDPYIELWKDGILLESNDNWSDAPNSSEIPAYLRPGSAFESVILTSLAPGAYTLIVRGVSKGTGVGLFEAYDLEPTSSLKLANVSTRGFVQTGDNVMIGGFILTGANSRVVLRGLGPSIPMNETLPDPLIELRDANGAIVVINDNWMDASNYNDIPVNLRPGNYYESAILRTLAPGAYTVILKDVNGDTGIGLFEAYPLDI